MTYICECGCGQQIPPRRHHKYNPPRFLRGHHVILAAKRGRPHKKRYIPEPEEIPSGICECGCGKPTPLATVTLRSRRWFRDYPMPYLHGHSRSGKATADRSPSWRGGRYINRRGYVMVYAPDHPSCRTRYVFEHRLVMERMLGRLLLPGEIVHHVNKDRTDNRPGNLRLMSHVAHNQLHGGEPRRYDPEQRRAAGRKGAAVRWGKPLPD